MTASKNGKVAAPSVPKRIVQPKSGYRNTGTEPSDPQDLATEAKVAEGKLSSEDRRELAQELGVSPKSLKQLGAGRLSNEVVCFPERDAAGQVIGLGLRWADGTKSFRQGGHRGLTFVDGWDRVDGPIYVAEGPSDVAAGATMGLGVIGRPSATGGVKLLAELLAAIPAERQIVVLGEFDAKPDGSWPGRDGAESVAGQLASALHRPINWAFPPNRVKDLRGWLQWYEKNNETTPAAAAQVFDKRIRKQLNTCNPGEGKERLELIDTANFLAGDYRHEWLVHRILVQGQPAIVGGAKKTLKTSLLVDLVVSLATGTKFLGEFPVARRVRVGLFSGESGAATLQETLRRIIKVRAPKMKFREVWAHWGFELPKLGLDEGKVDLAEIIRRHKLEVVVVDPLYLSLLAGREEVQATNLFDMGPLLSGVAKTCLAAGATPVMCHHFTKSSTRHDGKHSSVPELEDLAFAGIQEFARQWILVGRRKKFVPGSGKHHLWLNVGGSAGFSGCWAIDINEGVLKDDFTGRKWEVAIRTEAEERKLMEKEKQKGNKQDSPTSQRQRNDGKQKVVDYLKRHLEGETKTAIRHAVGIPKDELECVLGDLFKAKKIVTSRIVKPGGRSTREYPALKLA